MGAGPDAGGHRATGPRKMPARRGRAGEAWWRHPATVAMPQQQPQRGEGWETGPVPKQQGRGPICPLLQMDKKWGQERSQIWDSVPICHDGGECTTTAPSPPGPNKSWKGGGGREGSRRARRDTVIAPRHRRHQALPKAGRERSGEGRQVDVSQVDLKRGGGGEQCQTRSGGEGREWAWTKRVGRGK